MKNAFTVILLGLLLACAPQEQEQPEPVERSVGFISSQPDWKFFLGTEGPIKVVTDFNDAWAQKDYDKMRTMMTDTSTFIFSEGNKAGSADEFFEMIQMQDEMAEITWDLNNAYSVDFSPGVGGEHVMAGFDVSVQSDSISNTFYALEHYYVVDGKIISWESYTRQKTEEEKENN